MTGFNAAKVGVHHMPREQYRALSGAIPTMTTEDLQSLRRRIEAEPGQMRSANAVSILNEVRAELGKSRHAKGRA